MNSPDEKAPEPHWGYDHTGKFRYTDYDGEGLKIWRGQDGLWVDKFGEGPVYIRLEDIALIVERMQDTRTPREIKRARGELNA